MRVLLVDDEVELVSTLAERLAMRGIEAQWVSTAEGAMEKVRDHVFDVAVLDVKIPRVSGLDLKKKMERMRPEMKFIFMTGHGSEADFRVGVSEAGAAYYLVKPVNIDVLVKRMQDVLKEKGAKP